MDELDKIGQRSIFTCPECHGLLWEVRDATPQRFRCHTGHAFTARTLESQQNLIVEEAIWAAVRALHEKEALLRRFAKTATDAARVEAAAEHTASAEQAGRHAEMLRKIVGG